MPKRSAQKKKSKKLNRKQKEKLRNLKRYASIAGLMFISFSFLAGFFIYKSLSQDMASAFSPGSYDILNEPIYTASLIKVKSFNQDPLIVEKIYLYIFDETTSKVIKYHIPVDIEIDVPGKFGNESLSKIYALSNLLSDKLSAGSELLNLSIFKLLAFPVDRYVLVDETAFYETESFLEGRFVLGTKEKFSIRELGNYVNTDLNYKEAFNLYNFTRKLPRDRIIERSITQGNLEDYHVLDESLRDITFDSAIAKENKTISVLNGSKIPGIASFGARVIGNIGGRVVAVNNAGNTYENTVLIVDDINTETVSALKNIFGISEVNLRSSNENYIENEIIRSDITIIFGIDFGASL